MALQFVTRQIKNSAITTALIANDAVNADKIATGAVVADGIAANAVTTAGIINDAVTADKIATGAVVADGIAANAVTTAGIINDAVTADKIATGAVVADGIAANAVVTAGINNAAVTAAKADLTGLWNFGAGNLQLNGTAVATLADVEGKAWKDSVRVISVGNATLSSAYANGQTVDGVTIATNDRILLNGQTDGAKNGLYKVNVSGAPTRTTDLPVGVLAEKGVAVFVREGSANADTVWVLGTDVAITVNTTAIAFVQMAHVAEITAGTGLTKVGTTLTITTGGVGTSQLADDAVDSAKIADNAVVAAGIAANAVITAKIINDAVTADKIATGAVVADGIAANAVVTAGINNGAVTLAKLDAGSVDASKLTNNAVTTARINADAVDGSKIADNAVNSEHITGGAVDLAHLSANSVDASKLKMQWSRATLDGDGSAKIINLAVDVSGTMMESILVFVNGQMMHQSSNAPQAGEWQPSVIGGVTRITLGDTMASGEFARVIYMRNS